MLSLVYVSSATRPFTDADLSGILTHARVRNTELGITGVLAHRDGRCIQVLEGPDEAVRSRFAVISADARHGDVRLLCSDPIEERSFADWSMAFQPMDATLKDQEGFVDLFAPDRGPDEFRNVSRGRALVEWFRKHPTFR